MFFKSEFTSLIKTGLENVEICNCSYVIIAFKYGTLSIVILIHIILIYNLYNFIFKEITKAVYQEWVRGWVDVRQPVDKPKLELTLRMPELGEA